MSCGECFPQYMPALQRLYPVHIVAEIICICMVGSGMHTTLWMHRSRTAIPQWTRLRASLSWDCIVAGLMANGQQSCQQLFPQVNPKSVRTCSLIRTCWTDQIVAPVQAFSCASAAALLDCLQATQHVWHMTSHALGVCMPQCLPCISFSASASRKCLDPAASQHRH